MKKQIVKKVVSNKEEYIFYNSIKKQEENGYKIASDIKLASDGTWQVLMTKEVDWDNPNHNPNKPNGWGSQKRYW